MSFKHKLLITIGTIFFNLVLSGTALSDEGRKGRSSIFSTAQNTYELTKKKQISLNSLKKTVLEDHYLDTSVTQQQLMIAISDSNIEQTSCNEEAEVSFDKLSSAERILFHTVADTFVFNQEPPEDAGCSIYDDGVECHAFGYVCWIDSDSHGCAKETC